MPIKKSELYSSLWKSCDELRGGMDASQYKDYVLVLLFVKYVSDKYAGEKDALLDVPKGGSFADMVALKGDKEIGDKINKIIGKLATANDLKGVIDVADFNDDGKLGKGKEMVDRLSNLVAIFDNPDLDFRGNRAEHDDILGDAYEYLMRHFATESGKSKGQFYTPAEVSRIMAKVVGIGSATSANQTVYDPTCGSGSLLLKAHDQAPVDVSIYGQEKDVATTALAKMNMILHGCPTAELAPPGSSTLANPFFKTADGRLKTFDFVVANPPFSYKAWGSGFNPAEDEFKRFEFGIPPAKNGDLAFLLHILASLKSMGKAAVNLPHGVLFRGNVEADIRREIVRRGYFSAEKVAIENLEAEVASIEQKLEELKDEHSSEEGLLSEVIEDGKISKGAVTARLKEIKQDKDADDERKTLEDYLALLEQESEANKRVKDATKALETKVAAKYGKLIEAEIKILVVDDKWLATLAATVQSELDRVSQTLTGRIRQLAARYTTPLPQLAGDVAKVAARVDEHLKKMGAVWK